MKKSKTKTFGILTSGGDCPGLNAAIRGVAKAAYGMYDMNIIGIANGYRGLVEGDAQLLKPEDVSGILTRGGTILGTSREKPFKEKKGERDSVAGRKKSEKVIDNYEKLGLDCLVVLGGNGTHKTAALLKDAGLNVIGLPKTIDNDIWGTDVTFGFHTAVDIATDAIDRLHSTAHSHNRVMVVEVMGHKAGWLALYAGVAGGGDIIILPEMPYDISNITSHILKRASQGKQFSIVVVAEGAYSKDLADLSKKERKKVQASQISVGYTVAKEIEEASGLDTRVTVLGYQQRGGAPNPYDRILATQFGTAAAELLYQGEYGKMVAIEGNKIVAKTLENVAGKLKTVPKDHRLINTARLVDTCFGSD
ncbi:MAG: 6-phosphofructokinase [Spirochaetia bacterium]